jgi:predicted Zn finger-like uncharacterized protein
MHGTRGAVRHKAGLGDDAMRLICPNCSAQYEVDDGVIPDEGRDVQCSNCGNAWFQPGAYAAASEQEAAVPDTDAGEDPTDEPEEETADITAGADAAPPIAEDPVPVPAGGDAPDEGAAEAPAPEAEPKRRAMDDSMLSVLKEEAEREAEARRAEGSSLETQPDLGLAAAAAVARIMPAVEPEDRVAYGRDADPYEAEEEPVARGPRRELLPDIEVINSTLSASRGRSGTEAAADDGFAQSELRRSGFRRGFSLALLLTCLLLAVYAMAPAIKAKVPAAGPALDGYVAMVNSARAWLDAKMKSSTEALRATEPTGG